MSMRHDRRRALRHIVRNAGRAAALPLIGVIGTGCASTDNTTDTSTDNGNTGQANRPGGGSSGSGEQNNPGTACNNLDQNSVAFTFQHGVASGDPLRDRVILWTRITPPPSVSTGLAELQCEVASDEQFTRTVLTRTVQTCATQDWTVKFDATELTPGTSYWYRFRIGSTVSPTGRTRTLGTTDVTQVRLAVFTCANYGAGFFNAYAHAATRGDLDAWIHLGDYIYEFGRGTYMSEKVLGREVSPANETINLADYRTRYAQHRTDPDLQALHAAAPCIPIWDDHEFANNAWINGADNHQPNEGSWATRKAAAIQAYHEWLPIRTGSDPARIWRSFDFGQLLSLHMLETRVQSREQQLDYRNFRTANGLDTDSFSGVLGQDRKLIGTDQLHYLQSAMQISTATWQILGQQTLMTRIELPPQLQPAIVGEVNTLRLSEYVRILDKAASQPDALTAAEHQVINQPRVPVNLDQWDGYPVERERVLSMARQLDKNLVVLTGDSHNSWASNLRTDDKQIVGVEIGVPSVTTPGGIEGFVRDNNYDAMMANLKHLLPDIQYINMLPHGYVTLTIQPDSCTAEWIYTQSIMTRNAPNTIGRTMSVKAGHGERRWRE